MRGFMDHHAPEDDAPPKQLWTAPWTVNYPDGREWMCPCGWVELSREGVHCHGRVQWPTKGSMPLWAHLRFKVPWEGVLLAQIFGLNQIRMSPRSRGSQNSQSPVFAAVEHVRSNGSAVTSTTEAQSHPHSNNNKGFQSLFSSFTCYADEEARCRCGIQAEDEANTFKQPTPRDNGIKTESAMFQIQLAAARQVGNCGIWIDAAVTGGTDSAGPAEDALVEEWPAETSCVFYVPVHDESISCNAMAWEEWFGAHVDRLTALREQRSNSEIQGGVV